MELVSVGEIRAAADRLAGVAVHTPLLAAPWAGDLWLKAESLQPVGSFKLRGAYNALAALPPQVRAGGVVAHSSGNHAQAVAWAARAFGVPAAIVMPDVAVPAKVAATRALGAEVLLVPATERHAATAAMAAERGMTPVPPFDHRNVIAGQGTVGLEILADRPELNAVFVPVGGGGLASGVAAAVKALRPEVAVVGVEPELAADAAESRAAGQLRPWPVELTYRTVADGLRTALSELTLAHLTTFVDDIVTVTEDEIADAVRLLALSGRLVAEPSGAVSVAGFLRYGVSRGTSVAVVSGGNVDPGTWARILGAP